MKIRILPSAKSDIKRGFRFYEEQAEGIGTYFIDSIYTDIDSLSLYAGVHRMRGNLFRFCAERFPFWIYYRIEEDTTYIVAVLDARQAPGKILQREKSEQAG